MGTLVDLMRANLRRIRADRFGSQQKAAEALGMSQAKLSQLESGQRGWHTLIELEAALQRALVDSMELIAMVDTTEGAIPRAIHTPPTAPEGAPSSEIELTLYRLETILRWLEEMDPTFAHLTVMAAEAQLGERPEMLKRLRVERVRGSSPGRPAVADQDDEEGEPG